MNNSRSLSYLGTAPGFTLVELAIVLVVIGLLMGMAFKGKSLVDAARVKTDIHKVEKISAAINTYYAKYNIIPGKKADGTFTDKSIYDELIRDGLLKDMDFKMNTMKVRYHFAYCEDAVDGDKQIWKNDAKPITENAKLCLTAVEGDPVDDGHYDWYANQMSSLAVCYFETLLDDGNMYGGDGRRQRGPVSGRDEPEIKDCSQIDKTATYSYLYKIF